MHCAVGWERNARPSSGRKLASSRPAWGASEAAPQTSCNRPPGPLSSLFIPPVDRPPCPTATTAGTGPAAPLGTTGAAAEATVAAPGEKQRDNRDCRALRRLCLASGRRRLEAWAWGAPFRLPACGRGPGSDRQATAAGIKPADWRWRTVECQRGAWQLRQPVRPRNWAAGRRRADQRCCCCYSAAARAAAAPTARLPLTHPLQTLPASLTTDLNPCHAATTPTVAAAATVAVAVASECFMFQVLLHCFP